MDVLVIYCGAEEKMSFDYQSIPKERVACNLCKKDDFFILAKRSSNGYDATTRLCKNCGLMYISPRMTKGGYDRYYKDFYREDRAQAKEDNKKFRYKSIEEGFQDTTRFGEVLSEHLKDYINHEGVTIDIGSNSGGALQGFKNVLQKINPVGIEPSREHAEFADARGIKTYNCLFEDFPRDEVGTASNILCFHTLNHLLDPRGFFDWAYRTLEPGGKLVLAVKNFRAQVKRTGNITGAVQIDHPYMFTPETLRLMLLASGFRIVHEDNDEFKKRSEWTRQLQKGLSIHHIRVVAEKTPHTTPGRFRVDAPHIARTIQRQLSPLFLIPYYFIYHSRKMKYARRLFRIGY